MNDMKREEIAVVSQDGIASKITVFTGEPAPAAPVLTCENRVEPSDNVLG